MEQEQSKVSSQIFPKDTTGVGRWKPEKSESQIYESKFDIKA